MQLVLDLMLPTNAMVQHGNDNRLLCRNVRPSYPIPQNQVTMDVLKTAMSGITLDTSMITVGYARP